jgi:sulfur relay (sulfurtransferase) DsrC/TusE family protein
MNNLNSIKLAYRLDQLISNFKKENLKFICRVYLKFMDFLEYIPEYKNTSNNLGEEKCNFKYLNSTFNASLLLTM